MRQKLKFPLGMAPKLFGALVVLFTFLIICLIISKNKEITQVSKSNSALQEKKSLLQSKYDRTNEDLMNVNKEIMLLKQNFDKLSIEKNKLQDHNEKLITRNSEIKNDLNILSKELEKSEESYQNIYHTFSVKESKIKLDEITIEEFQNKIKRLKKQIQELEGQQIKPEDKPPKKRRTKILSQKDLDKLHGWLIGSYDSKIELDLFYASGIEDLNADDFHLSCDKMRNTLVILKIKETGALIGGFTYQNFGQQGYKHDRRAFLFNLQYGSVYEVTVARDAIRTFPGKFPEFGNGDLIIGKPYCTSDFPFSYGIGRPRNDLTGGLGQFTLEYIEIFEVTNHPSLQYKR